MNSVTLYGIIVLLLALVVYPYTLYPLVLWLLAKIRPRRWNRQEFYPKLSVIIAAHNEQAVIRRKIENTLAFDYPEELLEILVASDGSTDATEAIVEDFSPRVRLVRLAEQSGKQVALNRAVEASTGEVLLFTDAAVFLSPDAGRNVCRNFADPKVGAVSSVITIHRDQAAAEQASTGPDAHPEGTYLSLDLFTRRLEALAGSAVGCCGACYAVRRECFVPFDPGACNDFVSALDAVRLGYRTVMDDSVVGRMAPAKSAGNEWRRKVRTIAGGLDTLWNSGVLGDRSVGSLFKWQLFSHKVARWLGPVALTVAWLLIVVGALQGDRLLTVLAILSIPAIVLGLAGLCVQSSRRIFFPLRLAAFALVACWAALVAWFKFLTGQRQITWAPTIRESA